MGKQGGRQVPKSYCRRSTVRDKHDSNEKEKLSESMRLSAKESKG